ncbi:hypothetical protein [Rhizobium sp. 11515TR]|uniref:hypothetical protein n=1 Tax=Rhizobium sp. 11515TR TaxID=2028343 RepID=UPI000BA8CB52|nr:hypothetical protein [Rhizobium sp. 11515TR]ASW06329.1 hypothetical protein CKA34_10825 [Rhizobium sp. 11515TR]
MNVPDLSFEAVNRGQYKAGFDDAIKLVADWIETQRKDVPAHGWEFAAAIREMALQEGKGMVG